MHPRELANVRRDEGQTAADGLTSNEDVVPADPRPTISQFGLDAARDSGVFLIEREKLDAVFEHGETLGIACEVRATSDSVPKLE